MDISKAINSNQIHLGMTKADLRELLGPPDDWSTVTRGYPEPAIWKYGNIEFTFAVRKYRIPWPGPKLIWVMDEDHSMLLK